MKHSLKKIRLLISENKILEVLQVLEKVYQEDSKIDEILLLKRRFKDITRKQSNGLITDHEHSIEINRITKYLLEIARINEFTEDEFEEKEIDVNINKNRKEYGNLSQIVLALCAVLTLIITGALTYNNLNKEPAVFPVEKDFDSISQDISQESKNKNIEVIEFNPNPPVTDLYPGFLDDFDSQTSMHYVRSKLGAPQLIYDDYVVLFEENYDLVLERYTYSFADGLVNIWSDSTKSRIEIIELILGGESDLKISIPTLSRQFNINGRKNNVLGDLTFNDLNDGYITLKHLTEGNIDDYYRFHYDYGRYGGYRYYMFAATDLDQILYEKNIDPRDFYFDDEQIMLDTLLSILGNKKPNSVILY